VFLRVKKRKKTGFLRLLDWTWASDRILYLGTHQGLEFLTYCTRRSTGTLRKSLKAWVPPPPPKVVQPQPSPVKLIGDGPLPPPPAATDGLIRHTRPLPAPAHAINGSRRDGRFTAPIPVSTHAVRPPPPATQTESSSSEPPQRNPFAAGLLAEIKAGTNLRKTDFTEPTEEKQLSEHQKLMQDIVGSRQYYEDSPDSPNEDSNDNNNRVSFAPTVPKVQSVPEAEKPKPNCPKPDQQSLIKQDIPVDSNLDRFLQNAREYGPSDSPLSDISSWDSVASDEDNSLLAMLQNARASSDARGWEDSSSYGD